MFMMIISKVLSVLLDPAALSLILLTVGIVVAFMRKSGTFAIVLFLCGFGMLLVFSLPITAHYLMRGLEGQYRPAAEYGQASAVVLLGGFTTGKVPPRIHVETNYAANRVFNAVRVLRQQQQQQDGAVPLVITGGQLDRLRASEASSMFELINEFFGLDSADMIIESQSLSTWENALYVKRAMDAAGLGSDIILVTSACHMPRAAAAFRKAGFKVAPAPTGYFSNDVITNMPLMWLPSAAALFEASVAFHEYAGIAVYKIMGWI
jgi:uncharacterized SAM-binding protein YcdF (DUF218 family)